jgi:adenine deaminase
MLYRNSLFARSEQQTEKVMNVALGKQSADLVVLHANILNVYTGELLDNQGIGISDKWIAYVGQGAEDTIGPKTIVIDANGKTVIPGFIDAHTHLAWTSTPYEFLRYIMKGGTTTIITESLEPYPVSGLPGVLDFIESLADQPIKMLATAPATVSISRTAQQMPIDDLKHLLAQESIVGLGESYWQGVIQNPELMLPRLSEAVNSGKLLEGHTAGASEKKLNAYIATGISSCHEPISSQEVIDRLRLGIHVMVREGSIRRDLEEISKIKSSGVNLRRLILATDGINPEDLMQHGYMEYVVQKAIACGFNPIEAIQMATLNAAEHFSLDHLIGGIAPGKFADLVIISDIKTIQPENVISNGRMIVQNGELVVAPRRHRYSDKSLHSIYLKENVSASDFVISVDKNVAGADIRVIEMITDLVTAEKIVQMPVTDSEIKADVRNDILKIAAIDRTHQPGKSFVGLIKGFSLKSGAFACSAAWDSTDIVVIGTNEQDMAAAVNRIKDLQGGYVLAEQSKIVVELPLPVFGLMSELSLEKLVNRIKTIRQSLADRGVQFQDPMLSTITLTGAAIPFLRICEEGLVSIKDGKPLELIVSP